MELIKFFMIKRNHSPKSLKLREFHSSVTLMSTDNRNEEHSSPNNQQIKICGWVPHIVTFSEPSLLCLLFTCICRKTRSCYAQGRKEELWAAGHFSPELVKITFPNMWRVPKRCSLTFGAPTPIHHQNRNDDLQGLHKTSRNSTSDKFTGKRSLLHPPRIPK